MPRYKIKQTTRTRSHHKMVMQRAARKEGHTIFPSTYLRIESILRRAQKAGTLKTEEEVEKARIALTAAALDIADEQHSGKVTIQHVMHGWESRLSYGGNCPPHKCLFRSIISREERIRESLPLYAKLSEEVKG